MPRKLTFDEMVEQAMKNSWPSAVNATKTLLPDGRSYVFRHRDLGELGRLLIVPRSNGENQLLFEAVGDPDDPMTQKRHDIFGPLCQNISDIMEHVCGRGTGNLDAYVSQKEKHLIRSDTMPCVQCNATTAMMVVAPYASTPDRLEDYACLMFAKIKEANVPAWIVGYEKEVLVDGDMMGEALVLKVWPSREPARTMLSKELNTIFDDLMNTHCCFLTL